MKKGDKIQGRTLYKRGHYLRKYGITYCNITFEIKTGVALDAAETTAHYRGQHVLHVEVWEHQSMMPPPIQLHVTAWQDAMEMTVLPSVQASQTVVGVWENLPMIPTLIQLHVTVWKDAMEKNVLYSV